MSNGPSIESTGNIILSKILEISLLVGMSVIVSFIITLVIGSEDIITTTINIVGIFGLVEITFGSFFGIGFSEVAYASRSAGNPIYGEMLFRDRLNYRSKQLMTGFNLIISGAILLLFSVMMSNI